MIEDDEMAVAVLRLVPPQDVSAARAQRLRERCHAGLRATTASSPGSHGMVWRRMIGPALLGAWSAIYLIETFRAAAALYGF